MPSLTVLELQARSYVESARAGGTDGVTVERPFPVSIVSADLLR